MSVNIAHDQSASKRLVCLAERRNSLSLERAGKKYMYAADIHGLLMSIFSINHLYQGLIALASTRVGNLVPRPHP